MTQYQKRKPSGRHKTFRILLKLDSGSTKTYHHPDLDLINQRYRSGEINARLAEKHLDRLLASLRDQQKQDSDLLDENLKALEKYYRAKFADKYNRRQDSCYQRLRRGVACLGTTSLVSGTPADLRAAIAKSSDPRRNTDVINGILRFIGREVRLPKPPKPYTEVVHISLVDFRAAVAGLPEGERHVCRLAICSGMRLGELFGLRRGDLRGTDTIYLQRQMLMDGTTGPMKTGKPRKVPLLEDCSAAIDWLCGLDKDERLKWRRKRWAEIAKKIRPELRFHDLRHSYAIELLNHGVSLSLTAQALGNSVQVCQEYYAGFELSDEGLDVIRGKLEG